MQAGETCARCDGAIVSGGGVPVVLPDKIVVVVCDECAAKVVYDVWMWQNVERTIRSSSVSVTQN